MIKKYRMILFFVFHKFPRFVWWWRVMYSRCTCRACTTYIKISSNYHATKVTVLEDVFWGHILLPFMIFHSFNSTEFTICDTDDEFAWTSDFKSKPEMRHLVILIIDLVSPVETGSAFCNTLVKGKRISAYLSKMIFFNAAVFQKFNWLNILSLLADVTVKNLLIDRKYKNLDIDLSQLYWKIFFLEELSSH